MESSLKNMFLSLTAISVCAAAALAFVGGATSGAIEETMNSKRHDAVSAVFGDVVSYDKLHEALVDSSACVLALDRDGNFVGAAIEASSENGFDGHFAIMVGFDAQGNVSGYSILESAETAGLGQKASEWFQKGSGGCIIGMNPGSEALSVKADGGQVDAISGSTITSRAFCECVNNAYQIFQKIEK